MTDFVSSVHDFTREYVLGLPKESYCDCHVIKTKDGERFLVPCLKHGQ